ncbi:ABC transporter ATP-binding protein [Psychroflexus sediminis]|uniref:ABC-type Fe3+/spermidine/putrescine transport systems, ATPase components n=1 Tax=Psychroflexus sediminis TaxID=470826 RepID=A0A1G7UM35_9FLAO|nr:ABC transporter ATP-binding protein [Psychroflexus sediminis]SDG48301.1 ABC-type Fe3+/spermidine/putrescine transport systems, ATPase components [Psychroflexus sediminis]
MLKVKDLAYFHKGDTGITEINFELQKGDHLAVIGESGCGKSTLIKSVYGFFDLQKGSVYWKDEEILGPAFNLVPGFRKFKHLSQEFDLMPFTTSEENIQKFLSRETPSQNKKRSDELIDLFDLEEVKHQKVKTLSGGQKQRVAIAQALANPPELILLDEPFSHIDQFLKHRLRRRLFQFLKKNKITCMFATHDAEDVLPFSDFTMILKDGKSIDFRPTFQVYNQPKNVYCASLFGDVNSLEASEFGLEGHQEKVLVYPHEIDIQENATYKGRIISSYFKGSHYLVEIDYKFTSIFATSKAEVYIGDEISFGLDKEKIMKRLN